MSWPPPIRVTSPPKGARFVTTLASGEHIYTLGDKVYAVRDSLSRP